MAVSVPMVLQRVTLSHQSPVTVTANGRAGSHAFGSNSISPPVRWRWQPLLCDSRYPLTSCDHNTMSLGLGHIHSTTYSPSNCVVNSIERIESARWAALVSLQLPVWMSTGSASGEEIVGQVKGEAENEVLVNSDGSQFITFLLYVAIAGLSLLTIGVIYLAVTDFLEKREREKLLKEEEAKKKKEKKAGKVKIAKSGPRGFGQRLEEDD